MFYYSSLLLLRSSSFASFAFSLLVLSLCHTSVSLPASLWGAKACCCCFGCWSKMLLHFSPFHPLLCFSAPVSIPSVSLRRPGPHAGAWWLDRDRWSLLPSWQHYCNAAKRAQVSKWSLSRPVGWWDAIVAAVMELQEGARPGRTGERYKWRMRWSEAWEEGGGGVRRRGEDHS